MLDKYIEIATDLAENHPKLWEMYQKGRQQKAEWRQHIREQAARDPEELFQDLVAQIEAEDAEKAAKDAGVKREYQRRQPNMEKKLDSLVKTMEAGAEKLK